VDTAQYINRRRDFDFDMIDGKRRRLVDEIDVISSVSGGSFTAAYFGLFGDRIFEDFETKFLKFNVQGELFGRMLSPFSWPKLASLFYERSELAADYYDELLFENTTFGDILSSNAPLIAINATDIALGAQFTFLGNQFAPICSDLLSFPISRAVTASSAVPGAFSSVIIDNYGGSCEYEIPNWAALALDGPYATTHRYRPNPWRFSEAILRTGKDRSPPAAVRKIQLTKIRLSTVSLSNGRNARLRYISSRLALTCFRMRPNANTCLICRLHFALNRKMWIG